MQFRFCKRWVGHRREREGATGLLRQTLGEMQDLTSIIKIVQIYQVSAESSIFSAF